MPTSAPAADPDPRPLPPTPPDPADCCGEGCVNCILDVHDAAMARHEARLAEWRLRHPGEA